MEWRRFGVPWVYTLNSDVFARRAPPPSPDSLSWEPAGYINNDGIEHEYERPITYPLDDGSEDDIVGLNDMAWSDIRAARETALFDRPVAHFFVRGFRSDGIDEFLAHISTIEAARGIPLDHDPRAGATHRVSLRIAGLLGDRVCGEVYSRLFGLRSDFLHGKSMADISGNDRRNARELARKVVCALIGAGSSNPMVNCEHLLDQILGSGARLSTLPESEAADGH